MSFPFHGSALLSPDTIRIAADCVATAPTPASAQETRDPTENQWDWTATPISPVFGSRPTIENVCAIGPLAGPAAAPRERNGSLLDGAAIRAPTRKDASRNRST